MFIDFHTHTKMSKDVDFNIGYFKNMIKSARKNGLTAIALTEHFNTRRFEDIYDTLDQHYSYTQYYDVDGFKVFSGMEIDIKETGHILLIGHRDDIRKIRSHFADRTDKDNFPSFDELFDIAHSFNLLKIGGHPTRKSTPLIHLGDDRLQQFDAFDLNGKDVAKQPFTQEEVIALGQRLNKPVVAGSDSHLPVQFGCVKNQFFEECDSIDQLRNCMLSNNYKVIVSNEAAKKVKEASFMKETIKLLKHVY
ncbi:PHP domain-containing protein [Bacillus sp. 03113]|uniref:PHP domain-containing protein n=1 Tax=Bacillus sp. 03113 TaxID=2578211 RepID=UPI001142DBEC|nr:PHP domain-containing protein [Bacillus sp. 03113]